MILVLKEEILLSIVKLQLVVVTVAEIQQMVDQEVLAEALDKEVLQQPVVQEHQAKETMVVVKMVTMVAEAEAVLVKSEVVLLAKQEAVMEETVVHLHSQELQ